jgi:hypothetical protein
MSPEIRWPGRCSLSVYQKPFRVTSASSIWPDQSCPYNGVQRNADAASRFAAKMTAPAGQDASVYRFIQQSRVACSVFVLSYLPGVRSTGSWLKKSSSKAANTMLSSPATNDIARCVGGLLLVPEHGAAGIFPISQANWPQENQRPIRRAVTKCLENFRQNDGLASRHAGALVRLSAGARSIDRSLAIIWKQSSERVIHVRPSR